MEKNDLYSTIKEHILSNPREDNRIETETELAERFGVSRYKVRKVLDTLVQMGLLDRSPRRGTTLKQPDKSVLDNNLRMQFDASGFDDSEFIEARILVECAILPVAVRRITPSMITKLESMLQKIEANASNPLEADKYDRDFHLLLLQSSGNRVLQVFSNILITWFEKTSYMLESMDESFFDHVAEKQRAILNCIKKEDAATAAVLMREHLLETHSKIEALK